MKPILGITFAAIVSLALAACWGSNSLDFSTIFVGANGPKYPGASIYTSADAVKDSWIPSALTPDELRDVLGKVDFERQALLTFADGEAMRPTESSIAITRVRQIGKGEHPSVDVTVEIGRCGEVVANTSLFVIAALERPVGSIGGAAGYDAYSSDVCRAKGVTN